MKKTAALQLLPLWCALAAPPAPLPPIKFTESRLENGLRVFIVEDHYAPVFSIAVSYNTGSRDERPGRTGFAHLFEHMMFKGSENVGAGEHFFLIFNNGGNMNGTTNADRTVYYETLPKNQLDLALFLESDRMRSLEITQANLDNQREAVKEERRIGIENRPYGRSYEKLTELAFDNFAYKHTTIGSMEDLNAATVEDVKEFFRIYYAPNNAALALVGDLNTKETLEKVKKYFAGIPRQDPPKSVDLAEPARTEERRATIEDKLARTTQIHIVWKLPPGGHVDIPAVQQLRAILVGGESSRLYQKLVKEKEVATSVFGGAEERAGPSLFHLIINLRPGKEPAEVETLIDQEMARLHGEEPNEAEVNRARSMSRRSEVSSRESSFNIAYRLTDYTVLYNDPNRINTQLAKQLGVSAADMQRVAKQYFRKENRVVVTTLPAAQAAKPKQGGN